MCTRATNYEHARAYKYVVIKHISENPIFLSPWEMNLDKALRLSERSKSPEIGVESSQHANINMKPTQLSCCKNEDHESPIIEESDSSEGFFHDISIPASNITYGRRRKAEESRNDVTLYENPMTEEKEKRCIDFDSPVCRKDKNRIDAESTKQLSLSSRNINMQHSNHPDIDMKYPIEVEDITEDDSIGIDPLIDLEINNNVVRKSEKREEHSAANCCKNKNLNIDDDIVEFSQSQSPNDSSDQRFDRKRINMNNDFFGKRTGAIFSPTKVKKEKQLDLKTMHKIEQVKKRSSHSPESSGPNVSDENTPSQVKTHPRKDDDRHGLVWSGSYFKKVRLDEANHPYTTKKKPKQTQLSTFIKTKRN